MREPAPFPFSKWHGWAEEYQIESETIGNEFGLISALLLQTRHRIKAEKITDVKQMADLLLPFDVKIEKWRAALPESWLSSTVHITPEYRVAIGHLYDEYEVWNDLWIASMWGNYCGSRVMLYHDILKAIMEDSRFTTEHLVLMRRCIETLCMLTRFLICSVPFHLGYTKAHPLRNEVIKIEQSERSLAGGYILIWMIFIMGGLRTTSPEQRKYAANLLDKIALGLGNQHAKSLATQLKTEKTYDPSEPWHLDLKQETTEEDAFPATIDIP